MISPLSSKMGLPLTTTGYAVALLVVQIDTRLATLAVLHDP